jgi:hypothetical protein
VEPDNSRLARLRTLKGQETSREELIRLATGFPSQPMSSADEVSEEGPKPVRGQTTF